MKQIWPFIPFFLLLISCEKGKSTLPSSGRMISSTPSKAGFSDSSEKSFRNTSEPLELQIPMSNEQLKNWIPQKVGAMVQRKLIVGHKQGMEMSGAIATYQQIGQDTVQISLEVLDGAGATGAVMLKSITQKLKVDYQEEMNTGQSRIYEREGIRVWEKFNIKDHHSEIEFVLKERYHFIFKGHQIKLDELWVFVKAVQRQME
jgi:hypothetical protein